MLAIGAASLALGVSACGGGSGDPVATVATVAGTTITKGTFEHWFMVNARDFVSRGEAPAVPDPPGYRACVGTLERRTRPGEVKPSSSALKEQCQQEYQALKAHVIGFLVGSEWLLDEARSIGVTVASGAVREYVDAELKQAYPRPADFRRFVKDVGVTSQDLLFVAKTTLLGQRVRAALGRTGPVPESEVAGYYAKHRQSLRQPETRRVAFVLTRSRATAQQARKAIDSGMPWDTVVRKYSMSPSSSRSFTKPPALQDNAFDREIFSANENHLVGPILGGFGTYAVFRVTSITRPHTPTLQQAHAAIVKLLQSQAETVASNRAIRAYQQKYRLETVCAPGFVMAAYCGNAAKRAS